MLNLNDWKLRRYKKTEDKILALDDEMQKLSDEQLQAKTAEFRQRLADGEKLDNLLVEAYAVVREADFRVLGMKPFPVQVLGATILNDRNIAEMATGEGKTLTATMPMYLNGLLGAGAFLVTANEYLAIRDAEEMGQVYQWLGLTVGTTQKDQTQSQKNEMYEADIVYTTYGQVGFDYLFDNLASNPDDKIQSDFRYALIDEVDSVLIDSAQMPLVIAGAPKLQSNLYKTADNVVKNLVEDEDFEQSEDKKEVWITEKGISKLEKYFGIESLMAPEYLDLYRHVVLSLRANYLYTINRDYVVYDDKVLLLDITDGRMLQGIHLEAGLHQALEAKEDVSLTPEQKTMASVTYQNLFGMFEKLAGMTGTAYTDRKELIDVYQLDVLKVPTNKPNIRQDFPDELFADTKEKLYASLEIIQREHAKGRPILIETGSVSLSELYSLMLLEAGFAHNVLNAKSSPREAQIVANAGQKGTITVATSMAGRGTDIKLGEGVAELGGLLVLGTERMSSIRVDNQLRGRAGRQGDPGSTQFYISLDDRVVIENSPKQAVKGQKKLMQQLDDGKRQANKPIRSGHLVRTIKKAQKKATESSSKGRMNSVSFDDIQRAQQQFIYQFRDDLMDKDYDELLSIIKDLSVKSFTELIKDPELTVDDVIDYINNNLDYDYIFTEEFDELVKDEDRLIEELIFIFQKQLNKNLNALTAQDQKEYFLRLTILHGLDNAWIEQVDNLHQLRGVVAPRGSASHDPIAVYQMEAVNGFNHMKSLFWKNVISNVALSQVSVQKNGEANIEFP